MLYDTDGFFNRALLDDAIGAIQWRDLPEFFYCCQGFKVCASIEVLNKGSENDERVFRN